MWTPFNNALLGSLVVTVGLWMTWGDMSPLLMAGVAVAAAAALAWLGTTIARVWAWATLLLGVESLAWPIVTMARIRLASAEPSEEEMGLILTAVLFGLFSSIFWLTFSYGIFKRMVWGQTESAPKKN